MTSDRSDHSPIEAAVVPPSPRDAPQQLDAQPTEAKTRPNSTSMLQSRGVVLATLFLVTGALGIPLLWVSRQFSTTERVFWTIVVALYTTVLLIIAGGVMWWMYQRAIDALYS